MASLSLLLLTSGVAAQEDGPYTNYLVGGRSLGLAGALVGIADDPTAVFHNPAGLAQVRTGSVSGGLWSVSLAFRNVDDGYRTSFAASDLEAPGSLSLPSLVAGAIRFGPRHEQQLSGHSRRHVLGAAILNPLRNEYGYSVQLETPESAATRRVAQLLVRHSDRARWFGVGYAYLWNARLSLGASFFVTDVNGNHEQVEITAQQGSASDTTSVGTSTRFSALDLDAGQLVLRLGALLDLGAGWRAGTMFQLPGLRLGGSATVTRLSTRFEPASGSSFTTAQDRVEFAATLPWEWRGGASVTTEGGSHVTVDLSVLGPIARDDEFLQGVRAVTGRDFMLPNGTGRDTQLRAAVGFEQVFWDVMPMEAGVIVETAPWMQVPNSSQVYKPDALHTFGSSLSIGFRAEGYDLAVGATGLLSAGRGMALVRGDTPDETHFEATDVSRGTLFLFVAGGSRTASRLAKEIVQ